MNKKDAKINTSDNIDNFDELLNQFIEKEIADAKISESEEENSETGYATIMLDGMKYEIDAVSESEGPMTLCHFVQKIDDVDDMSSCILLRDEKAAINCRVDYRENDSNMEYRFYLFSEGNPKPLLSNDLAEFPGIRFDFTEPGNYFLVFTNTLMSPEIENKGIFEKSGPYFYRKYTVIKGSGKNPNDTIKVTRCAADMKRDEILVDISLIATDDSYPIAMNVRCYDSSLRIVGSSRLQEVSISSGSKTRLRFVVSPHTIWDDGNYHMVIEGNGQPMARLKMSISAEGGFKSKKITLDTADELAFILYRAANFKGWNNYIERLECFGSGRRKLASLLREQVLYDIRSRMNALITSSVRHFILLGDAPQSKKMLATAIPQMFRFSSDPRILKVIHSSTLLPIPNVPYPYEKIDDMLDHSTPVLLRGISALFTTDGQGALRYLVKELKSNNITTPIFIDCNRAEMEELFERVPEFEEFFPLKHRIEFTYPSALDVVSMVSRSLHDKGMILNKPAAGRLLQLAKEHHNCNSESQVLEYLVPRMLEASERRITDRVLQGETLEYSELFGVTADDVEQSFEVKSSFDDAMQPLMDMVGLDNLKERLSEYFDMVRFNALRKDAGLPVDKEQPSHIIFTGNPGTGKTTVAGYIGKIYHSLGLLSKGEVMRADRSRIVGEFIGQSERNMTQLIEEAKGNVLFIDEAYALCTDASDSRDFGRHALNVLLPHLSKADSDMLVILAGYDKDIDKMMGMNQGMSGRFPQRFHFDDYTTEQLIQIGVNLASKKGYRFDNDALDALRKVTDDAMTHKDDKWSNARWMEQMINVGIRPAMSRRVMRSEATDADSLSTITVSDVTEAVARLAPSTQSHRRVGFKINQ